MPPTSPASKQGGFSLIELLIGMVIALEILVAALTVFDVHNRMARIQLQITDMQQSLRVAQYDIVRTTRMAGRGGIPAQFRVDPDDISVPWLRGMAIEFRDNVDEGDDSRVSLLEAEPKAVAGTDILTVRGCLSGAMLQMDPTNPADFTNTSLTIREALPNGRTQDLAQVLEADYEGPVLLQSAINRELFAVAEVSAVTSNATGATLTISFVSATVPPNPLVTAPPANFVPGFACTLEEYRYYVRRNYETPGDSSTLLKPRLARARMTPGTEIPFGADDANLSLDLADEIFDLQIALGFDTDYDAAGAVAGSFDDDADAIGTDDVFFEGADDAARATDDWLGNSTDDDPTEAQYRVNAGIPARPVRLYYVRISTLGRTARPDPRYEAPDFDPAPGEDLIENNDYDRAPAAEFKTIANRQYRHRLLQTVVDLRNI